MGKSKNNRRRVSNAGGKRSKNHSGAPLNAARWIVIILVILLVIGAAIGIAFVATDGFGRRINTLTIEIGNESYSDNAEGVILNSGTEIRINSMTKAPFEYRIEVSDKMDFGYSIAGEKGYRWKYLAGSDVTQYFDIKKTEAGFRVFHNGIYDILKKIQGEDVVCEFEISKGDYFTLIVTCGGRERRFGFYPEAGERPTNISTDYKDIIFNPNKGAWQS